MRLLHTKDILRGSPASALKPSCQWGRLVSTIIVLCVLLSGLPAKADKRIALVIGNGAYRKTSHLANPQHDARAVAEKLESLGFSVQLGIDLTFDGMVQAQRKFVRGLDGADVALLFYAWHGIQIAERNYLVPVDAKLEAETDVEFETVSLSKLLDLLSHNAKVALVFLDACRNNPLASQMKNLGRKAVMVGLAQETTHEGELFIAYATDPGQVAADGKGKHSPFSAALLGHIHTPGLEVQQLMKRVTQSVLAQTDGQQRPWQTGTLQSEIFLAGPASDLVLSAQDDAAVKRRLGPPLYKRWWLWTAIGTVAAGAALGIGLGVAGRDPDTSGWKVATPFGQ